MFNNRLLSLIIILLILAFTFYLLGREFFSTASQDEYKDFRLAELSQIVVAKDDETLLIENKQDNWLIEDFPIKTELLENIDSFINNLHLKQEISSEILPKFIDNDLSYKLTFITKFRKVLFIRILKIPNSYSFYFSINDKYVYLLNYKVEQTFKSSISDWIDLLIFSTPFNSVTDITFDFEGTELTYTKESSKWFLTLNNIKTEANTDIVDYLLRYFTYLKADEIFLSKDIQIYQHSYDLKVSMTHNQKTTSLFFHNKTENNYYIQTDTNSSHIYLVKNLLLKPFLSKMSD